MVKINCMKKYEVIEIFKEETKVAKYDCSIYIDKSNDNKVYFVAHPTMLIFNDDNFMLNYNQKTLKFARYHSDNSSINYFDVDTEEFKLYLKQYNTLNELDIANFKVRCIEKLNEYRFKINEYIEEGK